MNAMKVGTGVALLSMALACGGGEKAPPAMSHDSTPAAPAAASGGPLTPKEGGKVITIEVTTDDKGVNKFVPNEFEAHQGDVLRFTLGTGVHNVHFPADSNPKLPAAIGPSQLLQMPGQTFDVAVDFPEGRYYFQCDPHALLGMIGHVKVEGREK